MTQDLPNKEKSRGEMKTRGLPEKTEPAKNILTVD